MHIWSIRGKFISSRMVFMESYFVWMAKKNQNFVFGVLISVSPEALEEHKYAFMKHGALLVTTLCYFYYFFYHSIVFPIL